MRIEVCKAESIGTEQVEAAYIAIDQNIPKIGGLGTDFYNNAMDFHRNQGNQLEKALFESLPGGSYDQLLRAMLERKASLLMVRHIEPGG